MSNKKPEVDPEFERIVSAVETLETVALEHESKQSGPHKHECLENRAFIVAMAAHRLGICLADIGLVAEHLVAIEIEHAEAEAEAEESAPDSSDDILDAKSLSGL